MIVTSSSLTSFLNRKLTPTFEQQQPTIPYTIKSPYHLESERKVGFWFNGRSFFGRKTTCALLFNQLRIS